MYGLHFFVIKRCQTFGRTGAIHGTIQASLSPSAQTGLHPPATPTITPVCSAVKTSYPATVRKSQRNCVRVEYIIKG